MKQVPRLRASRGPHRDPNRRSAVIHEGVLAPNVWVMVAGSRASNWIQTSSSAVGPVKDRNGLHAVWYDRCSRIALGSMDHATSD